jgi:hypothetical protein
MSCRSAQACRGGLSSRRRTGGSKSSSLTRHHAQEAYTDFGGESIQDGGGASADPLGGQFLEVLPQTLVGELFARADFVWSFSPNIFRTTFSFFHNVI